ncbi:SpoIIE family protein phosphatase [Nonomuraea sp. FMUSA5-5]|uniref:SpoIIE family protein phosphatase n=1 Tax=Nonomuraea composti TaxID=2720023 RepID=A0ABX1BM44_9ACTN|nr:SpoIIE family protein phosphatase [Nonomuraea sp. FMUSA5-5]NJP97582.1 SpoIIE family protein phosphatase [Nonomuraea sp. FMUSA5-5]
MTPAGDVAAVDEALVEAAAETGAHLAVLYLLHDGDDVLLMEAGLGLPAWGSRPWTRIRLGADAPVVAAVRRDELIWVPGPDAMAREFPGTALAIPYPYAVAAAPIHAGGRVRGVWALTWPAAHPADLSPGELTVINRTSHRIGRALEEAEANGRPIRAVGQPRALAPLPPAHQDDQRAPAALDCLDRFTDGVAAIDIEGHITFCNPAAAELLGLDGTPMQGCLLWDRVPWLRDPMFEDRCRAASIGQQPADHLASHPDGRLIRIRLYPTPTGISLHLTPAEPGGPGHGDPMPADGAPPLTDSRNLLHVASTLTRALDVGEVVDLVADHVAPVYGVRAMALLVAEGGRMRIAGAHGCAQEVLDHLDGRPVTAPTPVERVLRTGLPLFFGSPEELRHEDPGFARSDDTAAWALLPLTVSEQRIGTCVFGFAHAHRFSAGERAALSALAGLIAQALDRALLYESKDRLAHTLQTALLPVALPEVPGLLTAARYVPATRGVGIGGDFYDLMALEDGSIAAVIGDVQGHNMTAAALMGQVRTAVRAFTGTGADPGEVLRHANRLLIELGTDLFTSCLLAHVDLRLRTFCAASAGHPPPLLCVPERHTDVIDVPAGPLLGIDPDAEYPTLNAPFPPEAILVLYTDGLVEVPGTDLEHRIDTLTEHLARACTEPLPQLTDTLLGLAPSSHQRHADDIAVLLLKHDPSTAAPPS